MLTLLSSGIGGWFMGGWTKWVFRSEEAGLTCPKLWYMYRILASRVIRSPARGNVAELSSQYRVLTKATIMFNVQCSCCNCETQHSFLLRPRITWDSLLFMKREKDAVRLPPARLSRSSIFWSVYFYSPHQALCVDLLMINSPILMEYFYSWGLAIPDLSQGGRK